MAQRPEGHDGSTIRVMSAPVPSVRADKANENGSVGINNVMPVEALKPQMRPMAINACLPRGLG